MQDFGLERLRVRDEPLPARVLLLADVPRGKRRQALRLRGTAGDYTFLVARSAGALRAQHAVTDDLRPLPRDDSAPVVAVRTTSGTPQAPSLWLYQVRAPHELRALRRQVGGLGVVSSVSMSLLADPEWEGRWLNPLLRSGPVTILMDLNPFTHFAHWAEAGLQVSYCSLEAAADAGAGSASPASAGIRPGCSGMSRRSSSRYARTCRPTRSPLSCGTWPRLAHEDQDVARDRLPCSASSSATSSRRRRTSPSPASTPRPQPVRAIASYRPHKRKAPDEAAATNPASGPDPLGDFLHDGLAAVAAPAGMASADDLAALWAQLFPGQDGATRAGLRTFQTAFQTAVAAGEDEDTSEEALHLGGGGWRSTCAAAWSAPRWPPPSSPGSWPPRA